MILYFIGLKIRILNNYFEKIGDKGVGSKSPEQGALAHSVVAAQDHLLFGYAHRGHG